MTEAPKPSPPPYQIYECDQYFESFARMESQCGDKLPADVLAALRQARDAMKSSLTQLAQGDDESRATAADAMTTGCKASDDAIKQVIVSLACDAPK